MTSDWLEVAIRVTGDVASPVEDCLFSAGALAVTVHDADETPAGQAGAILEPIPGETPLWAACRVVGLFAGDSVPENVATAIHLAAAAAGPGKLPPLEFSELADQVWERTWMADFTPQSFGGGLWICPSHAEVVDPLATNLHLDPGLAFGTGSHPTTALCLEWMGKALAQQPRPFAEQRVIDFGCGSGVLAIAAALLGSTNILAVDIDTQALVATGQNATVNGVADVIDMHLPAHLPIKPIKLKELAADIVFANILHGPLIELAETFRYLTRPGGTLVMSGILQSQVESLTVSYTPWFTIQPAILRDEWALVTATRLAD